MPWGQHLQDYLNIDKHTTVYSGYSGHVYSGHSDIVATSPRTKYIYSIIFMSDIVANWILWPESGGPRWPLYLKCTVFIILHICYILTGIYHVLDIPRVI